MSITLGDVVGTAVSSILYSAITTTGDVTASATEAGIEIAGAVIEYGTEIMSGKIASNTVKAITKSYSKSAKYSISKGSLIGATCLSLIAYTGTSLTTTAVVYTGRIISTQLYSLYRNNKPDIEMKEI